jgi:tetratricopeptide (TPR) repeat protein
MNVRILPLLALAALVAACGGEPASRTTIGAEEDRTGGLPAELQTPIDSGNIAFRARDYETALRHYRQAASLAPDEPTGWFGVVMAADAMGNRELADSARARIDRIAPELNPGSHTSAGHPETTLGEGQMEMPAGHPSAAPNGSAALPPGHP